MEKFKDFLCEFIYRLILVGTFICGICILTFVLELCPLYMVPHVLYTYIITLVIIILLMISNE